jgi:hypothetical protein
LGEGEKLLLGLLAQPTTRTFNREKNIMSQDWNQSFLPKITTGTHYDQSKVGESFLTEWKKISSYLRVLFVLALLTAVALIFAAIFANLAGSTRIVLLQIGILTAVGTSLWHMMHVVLQKFQIKYARVYAFLISVGFAAFLIAQLLPLLGVAETLFASAITLGFLGSATLGALFSYIALAVTGLGVMAFSFSMLNDATIKKQDKAMARWEKISTASITGILAIGLLVAIPVLMSLSFNNLGEGLSVAAFIAESGGLLLVTVLMTHLIRIGWRSVGASPLLWNFDDASDNAVASAAEITNGLESSPFPLADKNESFSASPSELEDATLPSNNAREDLSAPPIPPVDATASSASLIRSRAFGNVSQMISSFPPIPPRPVIYAPFVGYSAGASFSSASRSATDAKSTKSVSNGFFPPSTDSVSIKRQPLERKLEDLLIDWSNTKSSIAHWQNRVDFEGNIDIQQLDNPDYVASEQQKINQDEALPKAEKDWRCGYLESVVKLPAYHGAGGLTRTTSQISDVASSQGYLDRCKKARIEVLKNIAETMQQLAKLSSPAGDLSKKACELLAKYPLVEAELAESKSIAPPLR